MITGPFVMSLGRVREALSVAGLPSAGRGAPRTRRAVLRRDRDAREEPPAHVTNRVATGLLLSFGGHSLRYALEPSRSPDRPGCGWTEPERSYARMAGAPPELDARPFLRVEPVHLRDGYRRESSRLCKEDDRSPSLSHVTEEPWQKAAA